MDGTARCVSCFRTERRRGAEVVEVTMPGGGRQPAIPAELAAWRTLRRVKDGELGPPVAACAACGQPMFAVDGELPPLPRWTFQLPDGAIEVGSDGRAIDVDDDEADRRIEEQHRPALEEKPTAGQVGFALVLLAAVAGIGAILGACECPSAAMAVAGTAGASAMRGSRGT